MTISEFFTAYSGAVCVLIGAICNWATENYSFVVVSVVLILAGLAMYIRQGRNSTKSGAGIKKNSGASGFDATTSRKQPTASRTSASSGAAVVSKQLDFDSSAHASPV